MVKVVNDRFLVFGSKVHGKIFYIFRIANCPFKELVLPLKAHCPNVRQGTELSYKLGVMLQEAILWP